VSYGRFSVSVVNVHKGPEASGDVRDVFLGKMPDFIALVATNCWVRNAWQLGRNFLARPTEKIQKIRSQESEMRTIFLLVKILMKTTCSSGLWPK
jgi:hypothetical protein